MVIKLKKFVKKGVGFLSRPLFLPSPEFLTFATAQVEILPSHKERGLFQVKH